jgi:hypothetical protein
MHLLRLRMDTVSARLDIFSARSLVTCSDRNLQIITKNLLLYFQVHLEDRSESKPEDGG